MLNFKTKSLKTPFRFYSEFLLQAEKSGHGLDKEGASSTTLLREEGGAGTLVNTRIADRESDYQRRRHDRVVPDENLTFVERMHQSNMEKETVELTNELIQLQKDDNGSAGAGGGTGGDVHLNQELPNQEEASSGSRRRKRRWDAPVDAVTTATTALPEKLLQTRNRRCVLASGMKIQGQAKQAVVAVSAGMKHQSWHQRLPSQQHPWFQLEAATNGIKLRR